MFSISTSTLIITLASVFVVRAIVNPSEPAPGKIYPEGGTCPISWEGDLDSTTIWKTMNIELMTGDNINMVHITTVATGQDGTINGSFQYVCPNVTIHSAIYFYQFTSPLTSDKTWTGRFAIASATGATTDPPNQKQPDGSNIPWGTGALADPSKAVPAPGTGDTSSGSPSSSGLLFATTSSSSTLLSPSSSSSPVVLVPPTSSRVIVVSTVSAPSTAPSDINPTSSDADSLSATSAIISLIVPALGLMLSEYLWRLHGLFL